MEYDNENQHKMFGTWLKITELKLDREALSARWTTVYRILENIDYDEATFLVDYLFGLPFQQSQLQKFQEEFHHDDSMFIMQESDNQIELKNLASVLLILLFESTDPDPDTVEFSPVIANYALSVSCEGLREASTNNTIIVSLAKSNIHQYAVTTRERKEFSATVKKSWDQAKIDGVVDSVDISDSETIKEAFRVISNTSKNIISAVRTNNRKLTSDIKDLIKIQDEELNILWWLINSYSSLCTCSFNELENTKKPLILGLELAKLTALAVEIPSVKVIFRKANIDINDTFTFSEFIDGTGQLDEVIATIEDDISIHTPILYALKSKAQNEASFEEYSSEILINNEKKISNIEWALQVYREKLACDSKKEYV